MRSPPFIARCFLTGLGVPLHTLMLITITKRTYLANGYSVVKDHSRFRHTKQNRWKEFNPSHLFAHSKAVSYRLKLKFFKNFFQLFKCNVNASFNRHFGASLQLGNLLIGQFPEKVQQQPASLCFGQV